MTSFRDDAGRTWLVSISVFSIKRVRALLGIDILALVDDGMKPLGKLMADPVQLVDVLYALCKDDADKLGMTDEDFGRAMFGDTIEKATDAFLAALVDFFPDPRVRAGLQKVIQTGRTMRDRQLSKALAALDSEAARWIASSGNAPEFSDSTPDPSPSASSSP